MSSDWYEASGVPGLGAPGASTVIKGEFESIAAAFAKMPTLTGNGDEIVTVNVGGTALTSLTVAELQAAFAQATELLAGIIELATQEEVNTGTDAEKAITPLTLHEKVYPITTITDTAYTLLATDKDDFLSFTAETDITLTLPADADLDISVGFMTHIQQSGGGQVVPTAGAGATVNKSETGKTKGQYASITVIKVSANTWLVIGDQELS